MATDFYGRTVYNAADITTPAEKQLSFIDKIGQSQTQFALQEQDRMAQARQDAVDLKMLNAQTDSQNQQNQNMSNMQSSANNFNPSAKGNNFNAFKNAISGQESGNNYGARNSGSGAMGKYHIMPANLGGKGSGWDYQSLGYDVTESQFMASPEIQENIANHMLQGYYDKYGPAGAAVAWYAGPGAADKYARSGAANSNGEAGGNPSVQSYIQEVLNRMGL